MGSLRRRANSEGEIGNDRAILAMRSPPLQPLYYTRHTHSYITTYRHVWLLIDISQVGDLAKQQVKG